MKKYAITSLLFLMPFVAMAEDDHCTKPDEYTIDKRCYVTEEQKTQRPYNSVALVESAEIFFDEGQGNVCTGTIVKEKDGKPYLYTAKHCLEYVSGDVPTGKYVTLQDSTQIWANRHVVPFENKEKVYGLHHEYDWAVLKFKEEHEEKLKSIAVDKSSKKTEPNAQLVGYGCLKIMSDKEISDLKRAYTEHLIEYLENEGRTANFTVDDNINVYVTEDFLNQKKDLVNDDENLKVSVCKYNQNGGGDGCQGWHGNSGGPIFDSDGKIMAITTKGDRTLRIGEGTFAGIAEDTKKQETSIRINDINLSQPEKKPVQKGTTAVKKTNKK